jgi:hypothetical protein
MAGSIKIQHGGTASTPQAGYSTLWVRSSDGQFYYTKPNGSSEPLVGATGAQGSTGPTGATDPTSLKTPSVISGTLQSVQDAAGNISALRISTTSITNFGGGAVAQNTAFGTDALKFNTTGLGNVAIGQLALNSNTTGNGNTAIGQGALNLNATGGANTAIGNGSLYYNTIGNSNTALGASALVGITTGSNNIGIGTSTGAVGTASCTIGIGQSSSIFPGATGTIVIGNNSTGATGIQNAVVLGNSLTSVVANTTHVNALYIATPPPTYSNNANAKAGGLVDGQVYKDSNGHLHIVFT